MNDIEQLFQGLLTGADSQQAVAKKLKDLASSGPQDASWNILQKLFGLASSAPEYHEVLIGLASEIAADTLKANPLRMRLWSNWQEARSSHHTQKCYITEHSTEELPPSAQKAISFTAFSARLLAQGIGTEHIGIFAFLDLREALEHDDSHWEKNVAAVAKITNSNTVVSASKLKEIDRAIAAQWIKHGGERTFQLRNEDFGDEWKGALEQSTERWNGKPGFSEERWVIWRERLAI